MLVSLFCSKNSLWTYSYLFSVDVNPFLSKIVSHCIYITLSSLIKMLETLILFRLFYVILVTVSSELIIRCFLTYSFGHYLVIIKRLFG